MAGAVAALLGLVTAALVLVGVLLTPWLIAVIAPGFDGREARADHPARPHPVSRRRAAGAVGVVPRRPQQPPPVLPELRRAGAVERRDHREPGGVRAGHGAVPAGRDRGLGLGRRAACCSSACSFPRWRGCSTASGRGSRAAPPQVRAVLRNFGPVFVGRGVVQISAYVDTVLASLLPTGAVAGLSNAQVLYTLPVSLFGMSVSAAELPAMASAVGSESERGGAAPAAASTRGCARSRSSSCRRRWRFSRSATWSPARCTRSGAIHPRDDGLRLGHPGRLGRRAAGVDAWAGCTRRRTTRCTIPERRCGIAVLRVALTTVLGYLFAIPLPRALGHRPAVGRGGADRVGGHRGVGRVAAAPARAQRPDRAGPGCAVRSRRDSGVPGGGAGGAWAAVRLPCRRRTRSSLALGVLTAYGRCIFS